MRAVVVITFSLIALLPACGGEVAEPGTPSLDAAASETASKGDASSTSPTADAASKTPVAPSEHTTAAGARQTDPTTGFIIDDGWETVAASCTGCHSAKLVTQNRGDRARWTETIRWMQKTQGLWVLAPAVEETILTYLSKNYAPNANVRRQPIPPSLMPPTPEQIAKTRAASALLNDPRVAIAKEALAPFQQALLSTLKAGLEKGPTEAVLACNDQAPRILASQQKKGVAVGRTTTKLRSPANAPEPWARALLDEMAQMPFAELAPRAILVDDPVLGADTLAFVAPIQMGAMCLTCHGTAIAPDVDAAIRARYPDDQARGYSEGDFRGLFFVKVARR
jgi:cytochrome c5